MSRNYNWVSPETAGLWKFDNDLTDSSPNGNNGSGTMTYDVGRFGQSAIFTGSTKVTIKDATSPPAAMRLTEFTAMLWYKGTDPHALSALFGAGGTYVDSAATKYVGYYLWTRYGIFRLTLSNGNSSLNPLEGSVINDGIWHHVAATRDNNYARLYVDGRMDAEVSSPVSPTFGTSAYYRFTGMGAAYVPGFTPLSLGRYPTCIMDDVQLFSRAWTEKEMRRYYAFMSGAL